MSSLNTKVKLRADTLENWNNSSLILLENELCVVYCGNDIVRFKIGDGEKTFSNLKYTDEVQLTTNLLKASNIVVGNNTAQNGSIATGVFTSATGTYSQAHGIQTSSTHNYSFVWNGTSLDTLSDRYTSKGVGTFSINPVGGIEGFYIGNTNLKEIVADYDTHIADTTIHVTSTEKTKIQSLSNYDDVGLISVNSIFADNGKVILDNLITDSSGKVYAKTHSNDGNSWTQSNKTNAMWYGSAYGNGKYVAGTLFFGLWYSEDGINWAQSNITSNSFYSIVYGERKFVAASGNGLYYSYDGVTWLQSNKKDSSWKCITYGNGKFIASCITTADFGLWYSPDGIDWYKSNKTDLQFYSLTYANGKYIGGSNNGGLWYSYDGINWTQSNKTDLQWYGLTYGNGKYVAGSGGSGLWYSTDGITWTQSNKTDCVCLSLTFGFNKFIFGGQNTGLWYSTDGINWSQSTKTNLSWNTLTYGNNKLIAGSMNSGIWYSEDIITKKSLATDDQLEDKVDKVNGSSLVPDTKVSGYDSHLTNTEIHVTSTEKNTWNNKLDKNTAITGATKCKITYDSNGLVTSGSDLISSDIPDLSSTYLKLQGNISSSSNLASLSAGIYTINGVSHSDFPVSGTIYGCLIQGTGTYKPQLLIGGGDGVSNLYSRRWLTSKSTFTSWTKMPSKISELTDDTATNPIDKADTLTGLTSTVTELNYTDGVTSNIQTQLDSKVESVNTVTPVNGDVTLNHLIADLDDKDVEVYDKTSDMDLENFTSTILYPDVATSCFYGNKKFLISYKIIGEGYFISYSSDCINWSQTIINNYIKSFCYGNGKYIAVGKNILYSTDGINWNTAYECNNTQHCVTYGNGKYVCGTEIGIIYSTNGIDWINTNKQNLCWKSISYSNNKFIAGSNENGLWYSTDGINWTQSNKTDLQWTSITYGQNKYIATSYNNGIWYSTDCINWTQSNKTNGYFSCVIYHNGKYAATSLMGDGQSGLWYSTNGIDWTRSSVTSYPYISLCHGNGKTFITTSVGTYYSTDKIVFKPLSTKEYTDTKVEDLIQTALDTEYGGILSEEY